MLRLLVVRLTSLHLVTWHLSLIWWADPSTTFVYHKVRSAWPDDTSVHRVIVRIIPCTYIIGVRSFGGHIVLADLLVPCVMFLFVAQLATLSTLYISSVFAPGSDVVRFTTFRARIVQVYAGSALTGDVTLLATHCHRIVFVARKFLRNVSDR